MKRNIFIGIVVIVIVIVAIVSITVLKHKNTNNDVKNIKVSEVTRSVFMLHNMLQ